MGHLFQIEGITAAAPGLFSNLEADFFWSGTEFSPDPAFAWFFYSLNGGQNRITKYNLIFAWAVRSGVSSSGTQ